MACRHMSNHWKRSIFILREEAPFFLLLGCHFNIDITLLYACKLHANNRSVRLFYILPLWWIIKVGDQVIDQDNVFLVQVFLHSLSKKSYWDVLLWLSASPIKAGMTAIPGHCALHRPLSPATRHLFATKSSREGLSEEHMKPRECDKAPQSGSEVRFEWVQTAFCVSPVFTQATTTLTRIPFH